MESLKLFCDACAPSEYGIKIESTINPCLQGLLNKSVGAGCAPSELDSTINLNEDAVLQLKKPLCSFAASWEALYILFELKQLAECRSRTADKLVGLAECKPRPADKFDGLAERESRVADKSVFADGSRAAGMMELANRSRAAGKVKLADGSRAASKVGVAKRKPGPVGNIFWELSVAAIGCSAKNSGSDFILWHSPQV